MNGRYTLGIHIHILNENKSNIFDSYSSLADWIGYISTWSGYQSLRYRVKSNKEISIYVIVMGIITKSKFWSKKLEKFKIIAKIFSHA